MILVINPGSTSLKYTIFDQDETVLDSQNLTLSEGSPVTYQSIIDHIHQEHDSLEVDTIIVRVVHGGDGFVDSVRVDKDTLLKLEEISHLAPLHNPPATQLIRSIHESVDTPVWAVFDTTFHATLPERASRYAIPKEIADTHHIKKY